MRGVLSGDLAALAKKVRAIESDVERLARKTGALLHGGQSSLLMLRVRDDLASAAHDMDVVAEECRRNRM